MQDMAPYVGVLVPDLQAALVDPLPEVRATAAKALGSLLRGMGEEHFQDLVPWLLTTLQSGVRPSPAALPGCPDLSAVSALCVLGLLWVLLAPPCSFMCRSAWRTLHDACIRLEHPAASAPNRMLCCGRGPVWSAAVQHRALQRSWPCLARSIWRGCCPTSWRAAHRAPLKHGRAT